MPEKKTPKQIAQYITDYVNSYEKEPKFWADYMKARGIERSQYGNWSTRRDNYLEHVSPDVAEKFDIMLDINIGRRFVVPMWYILECIRETRLPTGIQTDEDRHSQGLDSAPVASGISHPADLPASAASPVGETAMAARAAVPGSGSQKKYVSDLEMVSAQIKYSGGQTRQYVQEVGGWPSGSGLGAQQQMQPSPGGRTPQMVTHDPNDPAFNMLMHNLSTSSEMPRYAHGIEDVPGILAAHENAVLDQQAWGSSGSLVQGSGAPTGQQTPQYWQAAASYHQYQAQASTTTTRTTTSHSTVYTAYTTQTPPQRASCLKKR
ncbi:hypothetical protein ACIQB5_51685 [Streptomyces sp. NPDC088560]|uniref:hypothetical protein n=1 Tax=Streptomyces sp. NPDC088560 TaxID=3365868 RepID=UPI00380ABEA4